MSAPLTSEFLAAVDALERGAAAIVVHQREAPPSCPLLPEPLVMMFGELSHLQFAAAIRDVAEAALGLERENAKLRERISAVRELVGAPTW